jgi:hypothetical protein
MTKRKNPLHPDAPLLLTNHRRPRTRREFLAQSFTTGSGLVIASSLAGLFSQRAGAALSPDLQTQLAACVPTGGGGPMIPFLCFDLAGGANIAGSNVLVGYKGGQQDKLSLQGYSMLGLPSTMAPNPGGATTFIDTTLGLAFHSDSAFLRGINTTCSAAAKAKTNGAVIPARSENDTGNNPHNPMYAIYNAGAKGDLVDLIGSDNSDSGGNSMAPAMLIDLKARPTQVTRPSDVTALVGSSTTVPPVLNQGDMVMAMESVARISNTAIGNPSLNSGATGTGLAEYYLSSANSTERTSAKCEILKSADGTDKFGGNSSPDPAQDQAIIGGGSFGGPIFVDTNGQNALNSDGEYLKTASIMKLVIDGVSPWQSKRYAAAGTIEMGGFDYHTGDRMTGEERDFRAGQCMGACLEYAHRKQVPLMLYVFSDGSLSSNGMVDPNPLGRGKNNWDSDNQSTGAAFFLVYKPGAPGRPALLNGVASQQLGWMRTDGSVETAGSPAANSVTQLVDMVVLNYLALHGTQSLDTRLTDALKRPSASILGGNISNWDKYIAFDRIV